MAGVIYESSTAKLPPDNISSSMVSWWVQIFQEYKFDF